MGLESLHLLHFGMSYGRRRHHAARQHRAILQSCGVGQLHRGGRILRPDAGGGQPVDQPARTAPWRAAVFAHHAQHQGHQRRRAVLEGMPAGAGADRRSRTRHHRRADGAQRAEAHQRKHGVRHAKNTAADAEVHRGYPQIEIELSISDKIVDFVEEGYDIAIRLGIQRDSRLVAYKLEDALLGVFGTPEYLKKRGTPRSPDELEAHDCIQYVSPNTGRPMTWLFRDAQGQDIEYPVRSRMRVLNDALGCIAWVNAGGGLYQTYAFAAAAAVKRGELVEVLRDHAGRSRPFSILYPQNRHLSAKVRAFVDFLRATLSVQAA